MKTLEVKRDHQIISSLCEAGTVITGTAILKKKSYKRGYQNVLLVDIEFEYMNNTIVIDHCWLQQGDYPRGMKKAIELAFDESRIKFDFTFYPYHDAVDRGMHGMKIHKILIIPPKKKK